MVFQYGVTEGYTPLREEVKKILAKKGVFNPEYDDVIITSGAQQANELSAKVLCNEGDTLLAEAPSYGKPIVDYDPTAQGAKAYQEFTKEFLARDKARKKEKK